jgi:hypothetical protein
MATLHLELDIDSDVHPELFVRLASIERSPARQEKLRQLAATGLIWEIARLHGPAFSEPAVTTLVAPTGPPLDLGDAVAPAIDAGSVGDHPHLVPEDVPLLVDVVDEAEISGDRPKDATLSLVPPPLAAAEPAARQPLSDEAAASPAAPVEMPGGRTRSARIRRMKESGLFQNG